MDKTDYILDALMLTMKGEYKLNKKLSDVCDAYNTYQSPMDYEFKSTDFGEYSLTVTFDGLDIEEANELVSILETLAYR